MAVKLFEGIKSNSYYKQGYVISKDTHSAAS